MKIWIGLICATMGTIAVGRSDALFYSSDGGLVAFGAFTYSYDSATRLTEVWSNDVKVAEHQYDAFGRRVRKITPNAVRTFVYDGWLPLLEIVEYTGGRVERIDYCWGKDISGTLEGPMAGGTVDYYAPGWDVLWGHQPHDVATWELARDLGRIPDYYSVRPSW